MPQMQTIRLMQPIARACVVPETQWRIVGGRVKAEGLGDGLTEFAGNRRQAALDDAPLRNPQSGELVTGLQPQKDELAHLMETVNGIADGLNKLHEETLACHRAEIAKLAVEIARKILMYKVGKGDYELQAIVEEALKRAPTRQNTVIRLNPEDLPRCQQLQRQNPQSPFAELELMADWSIGRAECLVETPKGIVKSFIEEHLERIGEALGKVE
jgi:flagellar biosynthesis/type III secretory pathway protein FliH